mgnify:CR=1 FL=1
MGLIAIVLCKEWWIGRKRFSVYGNDGREDSHVEDGHQYKGGRKSVAMGSTGSPYAKKAISNLFPAELKRSYGEKSKSALGALMKIVPWSVLEPYVQTPAQVKKVSKDSITPLKDFKGTLPDDAKATLSKFPVLQPYGYFREIGGKLSFKVMIGTPGKTIK